LLGKKKIQQISIVNMSNKSAICNLLSTCKQRHCWSLDCTYIKISRVCKTGYAPYFYGASKKSLHKPRTTSGNRLFHISYGFNYYLQLLCLKFLYKTHLFFLKLTFGIKIALFLKSLLYQSMIAKLVHLQHKSFPY
jgi:hypothetical protein